MSASAITQPGRSLRAGVLAMLAVVLAAIALVVSVYAVNADPVTTREIVHSTVTPPTTVHQSGQTGTCFRGPC